MQPPLLVRASREHCALLSAPAAHGPGATLGGLCPPKTPWQEPEVPAPPTSAQTHAAAPARPRFARTLRASSVRCGARAMGYVRGFAPNTPPGNFTVLNRRASPYRAHRLFRTAPSGRCFGHWPRSPLALWTFHFHSKPCSRVSSSALRANIARLLCGLGPRGTGTLGGRCPPKTPCQEPEVPGPPGLCSKPCSRVSSSALRANIARFFMRPLAAHDGHVRGTPSP